MRLRVLPGVVASAVVVGVGGVWVAGARLPEEHVATASTRLETPPEDVWRAITDLERLPEWRTGVASVAIGRADDGRPTWVEVDGRGERSEYAVEELRFPDHVVVRVVGDDLPFGGTWTWAVAPDGAGSVVRITEEGYVRSAPVRVIAKYVIGHDATMRTALTDLGARFGQEVVIAP